MPRSAKIALIVVLIIIGLAILGTSAAIIGGLSKYYNAKNGISLDMPGIAYAPVPSDMDDALVRKEAATGIAMEEVSAVPEAGYIGGEDVLQTEQKVIKNANLTLKVDSAEEAAGQIVNVATAYQGFVQSSNIYESETGAKSGSVIIRVPANDFEKAITEIKNLANLVISEKISGQDVTEEFIDLEARLNNKYAEEQQYLEILEKATEVEDILMVTERLSWVRAEIERLEGRKKYLENLTDMSTISTYLTEEEKFEVPVEKWRPLETIRQAFRAMIAGLQTLADFGIWIIFFAVMIGLPIAIVVWIIILLVKKMRKRKSKK